MTIGQNASLNGFEPFLPTDPWRTSVAGAAVDPNSSALIAQLGSSVLHPDFGSGQYNGSTIGIPYVVVSGQPTVKVKYGSYASESDPGIMPIPASAWVEGYPSTAAGDRHVIAIDPYACFLYELGNAYVQGDGSWTADVGVIWNLRKSTDRPYLWTSADAAGLPIFPGLARYDEVAAGQIQHALRFTVQHTRAAFVLPATHDASNSTSTSYLPMGARLRLKASYNVSGFPPQAKVILTALKNYGMIVADNGSNMYLTGAPNDGWNNDDLHTLQQVPASAFEVVHMGTPITKNTVPTGSAPVFRSHRKRDDSQGRHAGDAHLECKWRIHHDRGNAVSGRGLGYLRACKTFHHYHLHRTVREPLRADKQDHHHHCSMIRSRCNKAAGEHPGGFLQRSYSKSATGFQSRFCDSATAL